MRNKGDRILKKSVKRQKKPYQKSENGYPSQEVILFCKLLADGENPSEQKQRNGKKYQKEPERHEDTVYHMRIGTIGQEDNPPAEKP